MNRKWIGFAVVATLVAASGLASRFSFAQDTEKHKEQETPLGRIMEKVQKHNIAITKATRNVAAFKKCMRAHGWVADAYKPDPPKSRADSRLAPGDDYISADTGMSCKDLGGIGICGPPRGTVHYRNDKGENCTRTGLVSI